MALLVPFPYTPTQRWGPSALNVEPGMYAYLGRAWWNWQPYPFQYYYHFHPGIDMAAPEGTPILASEAGTVTASNYDSINGNRINVQIRPGTTYVHGHLRDRSVWAGQYVNRGQLLGHVGHSGAATGNHSHHGVQIGSMLYDPLLFYPGGANANDYRILPSGTPTPTPSPTPSPGTFPRNLSFAPGTYTGRQFSSTGVIVASKSYTLTTSSSAPASMRSLIMNQTGYWYYITAGIWAYYWIKEGPGIT